MLVGLLVVNTIIYNIIVLTNNNGEKYVLDGESNNKILLSMSMLKYYNM